MKCRDCHIVSIVFVRMRNGKPLPVDPAPDELGNVAALVDSVGRLIDGHVLKKGERPSGVERLYMPHAATCSAREHPKKGGQLKARPEPEPGLF